MCSSDPLYIVGFPHILFVWGTLHLTEQPTVSTFSRHGPGGLAFFSSGHFKKLQDFDPKNRPDDWEGSDPFVGIDLETLRQVLLLDRVPWMR